MKSWTTFQMNPFETLNLQFVFFIIKTPIKKLDFDEPIVTGYSLEKYFALFHFKVNTNKVTVG